MTNQPRRAPKAFGVWLAVHARGLLRRSPAASTVCGSYGLAVSPRQPLLQWWPSEDCRTSNIPANMIRAVPFHLLLLLIHPQEKPAKSAKKAAPPPPPRPPRRGAPKTKSNVLSNVTNLSRGIPGPCAVSTALLIRPYSPELILALVWWAFRSRPSQEVCAGPNEVCLHVVEVAGTWHP